MVEEVVVEVDVDEGLQFDVQSTPQDLAVLGEQVGDSFALVYLTVFLELLLFVSSLGGQSIVKISKRVKQGRVGIGAKSGKGTVGNGISGTETGDQ